MEIVKVKISELKEYKNNAKLHPKEQIEQIKNSIKEFGFNDPIAIDQNNTIIEGHGRLYAVKELGYEEIECIRLSHLTEEQQKAYILAHNQLTLNTGFDKEKLAFELSQIMELDMSLFGFQKQENEVVEDDYEAVLPAEPKAKLGDIYQLGEHRLMCGDSTKAEYVNRLMNEKLADMCLTDPLYNVNYEGSNGLKIQNDNMTDDIFYQFLFDYYTQMRESLIPGGAFYIFHADGSGGAFRKALIDAGLDLRQTLIWVKNTIVMGRQDYQWQHEPILYGWKDGAGHYFANDRTQPTVIEDGKINPNKMSKEQMKKIIKELQADQYNTTVIHEDKPTKNDVHPTMKPLKLCGRLIKNSSKENDIVVDFFGGSGSTMMACDQLNRVCYTMEYDPKYVDVIIDRWEKLTGNKALFIQNINDK